MREKIYLIKGFFLFTLKKTMAYRVKLISDTVGMLFVPIILGYFMWGSLLENNDLGMTLDYMMKYIIISNVVLLFTQVHVENELSRDIKSPKLGQKILRPIGYLRSISLNQILSSVITFTCVYLPIIIICIVSMKGTFHVSRILYLVVFIALGYTLNSLFSFIIGSLSFWITEIWGIAAVRTLLTGLLAGAYFPLDLLPSRIGDFMMKLPFPYMSYFPAKIIVDESINFIQLRNGIIISIIWIIILKAVNSFLMKTGFKKYSLNGA